MTPYLPRELSSLVAAGLAALPAVVVTGRSAEAAEALAAAEGLEGETRDARLPASTATRYLGVLEASFVVSRLPPHLKSRAARLIKSPKLLMTDSGLAAHLTAVHDLSPTADERLRGALFETFVGQNLAALLGAHRPQARLEYWSVQGRHEVDFVVSEGRNTVGVEVKAATRFGERDLTGLRAFAASTPGVRAGILAYNGSETLPVGDRLWAVPLAVLLA